VRLKDCYDRYIDVPLPVVFLRKFVIRQRRKRNSNLTELLLAAAAIAAARADVRHFLVLSHFSSWSLQAFSLLRMRKPNYLAYLAFFIDTR
jgi:hypothetical protein